MRRCRCRRERGQAKQQEAARRLSGGLTLEKFETPEEWQKKIKALAQRYLREGERRWFCLLGQSGSGKTHLCAALLGELARRGEKAAWMPWREGVRALKAAALDEGAGKLIASYTGPEVLLVDDLYKGKVTEADRGLAYEILEARWRDPHKITLITSERPLEALCSEDEALSGRILERCGPFLVTIRADVKKDWRLRRAAAADD